MLSLFFFACALPESDRLGQGTTGTWQVDDVALVADGGLRLGDRTLSTHEIVAVGTDGVRIAFSERPDDALSSRIVLMEPPSWRPQVLADTGNPDRVAISADHVAWFAASPLGVVALYVDGVQRTNFLRPTKGGPPPGFVPPPLDAPWFEGDDVVWDDPEGRRHRVPVR